MGDIVSNNNNNNNNIYTSKGKKVLKRSRLTDLQHASLYLGIVRVCIVLICTNIDVLARVIRLDSRRGFILNL